MKKETITYFENKNPIPKTKEIYTNYTINDLYEILIEIRDLLKPQEPKQ